MGGAYFRTMELVNEPLRAGRSGWARLSRSGIQVAMFFPGGAAFPENPSAQGRTQKFWRIKASFAYQT
jgi:hypothetical protein